MKATNEDDYFIAKYLNARTNIFRRTINKQKRILDQLEVEDHIKDKT